MQVRLIVVQGKGKSKEVVLDLPAVIGRSAAATVTIRDEQVSREHCQLFESGGRVMIRDNDSTNGTFLDGQRIREAPLRSGSRITIGPVTFLAVYPPADVDASTVAAIRPKDTEVVENDTSVHQEDTGAALASMPGTEEGVMPLLPPTADGSPAPAPAAPPPLPPSPQPKYPTPPTPAKPKQPTPRAPAAPSQPATAAAAFDPYHKWFRIAPSEQPPNHYRLLGLSLFENDTEIIEAAADLRMTQVRQYQLGPHSGESQRLLSEIAKAKLCLLDPARRETYDAVLRNAQSHTPDSEGGEQAVAPEGPHSGEGFGPFLILDQIAASAWGPWYKAQNRGTGELVTLKLLSAEFAKHAHTLQRFRREAELAGRLRHPNLVSGLGSGEVDGTHYLVLEHVAGTHLAKLLRVQGALPVHQAIDYTLQAAAGLAYLHEQGVVHRNVKPHNLLVDVRGVVKVTNLLLARLQEDSALASGGQGGQLTQSGWVIGSVDYMAPEQATDARGVDARADIYSLGCTLYHLLTGHPPYGGGSTLQRLAAHQTDPIPSLRAARPEVPEAADRIFQKMVAKDPGGRQQSMAEVMAELQAVRS